MNVMAANSRPFSLLLCRKSHSINLVTNSNDGIFLWRESLLAMPYRQIGLALVGLV
jgi:hypothetical protein